MHEYQDPQTIYRLSNIINDFIQEYRIVMNYQKAWKTKEYTVDDLMGSVDESYAKIGKVLP